MGPRLCGGGGRDSAILRFHVRDSAIPRVCGSTIPRFHFRESAIPQKLTKKWAKMGNFCNFFQNFCIFFCKFSRFWDRDSGIAILETADRDSWDRGPQFLGPRTAGPRSFRTADLSIFGPRKRGSADTAKTREYPRIPAIPEIRGHL